MKPIQVILVIFLMAGTTAAQFNTAEVAGVVRDVSGAVLPGARVTAAQAATGFVSEQRTDANGEFLLASLPVGPYTITVEFDGFKPIGRSVALLIGQKVRLEFALEVGSVTEEITITTEGSP